MLATPSRAVRTGSPEAIVVAPPDWKQIVAPVEPFLRAAAVRLHEQVREFDPEIAGHAEYALTGQGKQMRPALVALSAGAVGQPNDSHILAAVIIEMVHLATLVHDDVMDEAEVRRGRPTVAVAWGNEISVLLGDCLFAHALKLAASYPTPEVCRAVAAATNTVCAGEILQTQRRRHLDLSRADYFKVLQMKTGELFALSCDLGACLAGAGAEERAALRRYGLSLGTAYQVYDDCVDVFGAESAAGKSLGTDLAKGKLTLPVLALLEGAGPAARARVREMVEDWQPRRLEPLRQMLCEHGVPEECRRALDDYLDGAREQLESLPDSESRAALIQLTDYLGHLAGAIRRAD